MDQQRLFKSQVSVHSEQIQPILCPALPRPARESPGLRVTPHNEPLLATGSSCHQHVSHRALTCRLHFYSFSLFFQMRTTTKSPKNVKLIQSLDAWFDTKMFLCEYINFLLLFNPVSGREVLQEPTLWMKPPLCLDISQTSSSTNSSNCWCLTPAISEWL